jgi:hypothetical protein
MNKVLLDIFSTQISDQRGSKKIKKNIFSHVSFFIKKYFFIFKNFFIKRSTLSKLRQVKYLASKWPFYTFKFIFSSSDILRPHEYGVVNGDASNFSSEDHENYVRWMFRDVNFCVLNFQK